MFFENESSLESKVELVDKIFLYSSSKKNDSIKKREVYQLSEYYIETNDSYFYKLHISRVYEQYQIGDNITHHSAEAEEPRLVSNSFSCCVSKKDQAVIFGPKGNLGMLNDKYKNRGLGRFCMAYLVRKLLSKGMGNYKVMSPSLSQQDAKSEDEKLLRNNFYKKSGFQFSNINIAGGRCSAPSIASLVPKHNRSKVKVIDKERLGKLLLANLDKTSKLTKNIVGLENALTYSKYSVKAVEQKYSVSIFLSMWLSIYAIWTLPFIDDIGKLVFSFLFAAASYVFCFQDVKVWVLDKLKRLTQ